MDIIWKVKDGPVLLSPTIYEDERGYFMEIFKEEEVSNLIGQRFVTLQENQSKSSYGTLRGMHCQTGEHAQAKIVSVVKGAVIDVVVDGRKDSPNYGKVYSAYLSEDNHRQFFVPRGFLHGFLTVKDDTVFQYKCDNYYNKESEASARWNSIDFNWLDYINEENISLSYKDTYAPYFDMTKEFKTYYF